METGQPAPAFRRTPAWMLRLVGLMIPAAPETIEMGYSYHARFVIRDDAYRAAFGTAPTPWDAVLARTLDSWRRAA